MRKSKRVPIEVKATFLYYNVLNAPPSVIIFAMVMVIRAIRVLITFEFGAEKTISKHQPVANRLYVTRICLLQDLLCTISFPLTFLQKVAKETTFRLDEEERAL